MFGSIRELNSSSCLQAASFMSSHRPLPLPHQQLKIHTILTQLERRLSTGRALVSLKNLLHLCNT